MPSQASRIVNMWKESLKASAPKTAQSLADPEQYENLFSGFLDSLKAEQYLQQQRKGGYPSASSFPRYPVSLGNHYPETYILN